MVAFDTVTQRARRVLIVASGKSATDLDLDLVRQAKAAGVYVLAVNRAWDWCEDISGWFTLDPDYLVMKHITKNAAGVDRFVAVPEDYGQPDARVAYHRNVDRSPGVSYLQRISGDGTLGSAYGLSGNPSCINTGNSGYGALGLAFHMKPERIALIGIDADRNTGYANIGGRPKTRLHHLPKLFSSAAGYLQAENISVRNGSPNSLVLCFHRCRPNEAVGWIADGL